jgi:PiT family inorganic phosphate transporter
VLRPQIAVVWAAFFNFIAFAVFGLHVAQTVGTGIVDAGVVDGRVIFGALDGRHRLERLTWNLGIPSSSSHALIGGLTGAAVAKAGRGAVVYGGFGITALGIVVSPLLGFVLAQLIMVIVYWASRKATPFAVDRHFRHLQLVSASLYSLGHGGNDAQKTMGIIAVLLVLAGHARRPVSRPFWVVLSCQAAMGLGTLLGGWRIVHTDGVAHHAAEARAGLLRGDRRCGDAVPRHRTRRARLDDAHDHRAIVGVGAARRTAAVRWQVAQRIVIAWVLTLPAAALLADARVRRPSAGPRSVTAG